MDENQPGEDENQPGEVENQPDTPAKTAQSAMAFVVQRYLHLTSGPVKMSHFLSWVEEAYAQHTVYEWSLNEWYRTMVKVLRNTKRELEKESGEK